MEPVRKKAGITRILVPKPVLSHAACWVSDSGSEVQIPDGRGDRIFTCVMCYAIKTVKAWFFLLENISLDLNNPRVWSLLHSFFWSIYLFLFLLLFLFGEVSKWIFLLLGLLSNSILSTLIVSVRKKEKVTKTRRKKEESCLRRKMQTIMISPSSSSSSFWSSSLCEASDFSFYQRKKESLFS